MVTNEQADRMWTALRSELEAEGYTHMEAIFIVAICGQILIEIGMSKHLNTGDPLFIEALKRTASVLQLLNEDKV